ncbi:MAG: polysaccharide pyruvyl transferase family protein [Candidatus Bathyarchaeota archaeon]|jgi:exopolysaccharide biosynthesis predicted pyruvyltransferase EpsI|nr:hypothetical protein [Candidatus Bathyarchaeota archaeon A05DMB-3]MDH7606591.1 polysaccharide pyruvyl transferase family protein [Candidatus Bathyarchaeota archaeon]
MAKDGLAMDEFESFLVENGNKKIYVISPGGNCGDTLIHMGLVKKLKGVNADYIYMNLEEVYKKRISVGVKYLLNIASFKAGLDLHFRLFRIPREVELILFEGGGYMNDLYYGLVLLKEILEDSKKTSVAVAPNSFWFRKTDFKALLASERPVTLFCREKYSYALLSEIPLPENVEVHLSKDTSLYLTREDLDGLILSKARKNNLVCFRSDRESMIPKKAKQQIIKKVKENSSNLLVADISKWGSLKAYVSAVANSSKIYTDRLHVAIVAHILRKEFTLFDNCYHKNRGVYEYSLKADPKARFEDLCFLRN